MWLFGLISYWANLFVKLSLRLGSLSLKDTKNLWASNKIEKPRIENVPTKTRNVSILLPAQYKEESRESNSISQFAQNNHRKTKLNLTEKIKISCNIEHLENKFITYSTHYQYSTKLHS